MAKVAWQKIPGKRWETVLRVYVPALHGSPPNYKHLPNDHRPSEYLSMRFPAFIGVVITKKSRFSQQFTAIFSAPLNYSFSYIRQGGVRDIDWVHRILSLIPFFLFRPTSVIRHSYIVTYDIRDDKRLRKVFKTMKDWGNHLQYSVFECQLTASDKTQLTTLLGEIINHSQDQVLLIHLGPAESRGDRVIEALGQAYTAMDSPCLVV